MLVSRLRAAWLVLLAWLVGSLIASFAQASPETDNWPAWRRDGSGVSGATHLPVAWSETQNVKWRTALPGEGNSSPIVWGGRVFLTAALEEGAKRLVLCLDADSGKILWQTELLPDVKTTLYPKTGFAAPTPATDGKRVYAFFDSPGLVALDMDGKVLWKRQLGPLDSPYNVASSPVLYRDTVIQYCDQCSPGFLVSFETSRGDERWRTPRKPTPSGHYSTPLLIRVQDQAQLIVNAEPVAAYDPDTGKELWFCRGMKECVAPSPVFSDGLVYASSGRTGPVMSIDPTGRGDVTETHVHMHLTSGGPYVPTPLVYPHLMVPGDNGKMLFYDAGGKRVADGRVSDHFTASPVGADGKIYWPSERGKTYVIDAGKLAGERASVKVLAVNQLDGECLASPAIVQGRLFLRTNKALYCIAGAGRADGASSTIAPAATFAELKKQYDQHQSDWKNEREGAVRLTILEAIAKLDDPDVIPFLLQAAQEPHWDVCEEAAKSLGRKGQPAVDPLIVLLGDSRPFIRSIAAGELGRLKAEKAIPGLLTTAGDKDPLVRSVSLQALAEIACGEAPRFADIITALCTALAHGPDETSVVKQAALDGLAVLAPKITAQRQQVVDALTAMLDDRNPRLAAQARRTLTSVYHAPPQKR